MVELYFVQSVACNHTEAGASANDFKFHYISVYHIKMYGVF